MIDHEREGDEWARRSDAAQASRESINSAEALGRVMCALGDVRHTGQHNLEGSAENLLERAERLSNSLNKETVQQMGVHLKAMNGNIRKARRVTYTKEIEPENTWKKRIRMALVADEALRQGLLEKFGLFSELGHHERASEITAHVRETTRREAKKVQELEKQVPDHIEPGLAQAISGWAETYRRIAGIRETPQATKGRRRD